MDKENRYIYIDCIRILACVGVVVIHCIAPLFEQGQLFSTGWYLVSITDSVTHASVPLFFMISGAVFLGRDIPVYKMYVKYILRIMLCFAAWSLVYAAYSGEITIARIMSGHFHMWYLYAIAGLYMITPLLKVIVEKHGKYFLVLSFIFAVCIPTLTMTMKYLGIPFGEGITELLGKAGLCLPMGYSFYFVAGFILSRARERYRRLTYLCIPIGMFTTVFMTYIASSVTGKADASYYEPMTLNIVMTSCGMFVFLKKVFSRLWGEAAKKVIRRLSDSTFGIYLVHILVRDILTDFMGGKYIYVLCLCVLVVSFALVQMLKCIPVLRRLV